MEPAQRLAYLHAWRSVIAGRVTTEPGKLVAIQDLVFGLVHWNTTTSAYPLEAVYDEDGAACRGTHHRRFADPAEEILGWDALPECAEPYSAWGSVAVRVPPQP